MILVDTNILSEFGKPAPEPRVIDWLAAAGERLFLPTVTLAELQFGVERMSEGRRKAGLRRLYGELLSGFQDRVLSFDRAAAIAFGEIMALTEAKGRTIQERDGMIAAIARCHGAAVATRDGLPFERAGLAVINPWEDHS